MSATSNPAMMVKGARAAMLLGYATAPESMCISRGLAMEVPSEGYDEDYAWIGPPASFEEFVDKVRFVGMSDGIYALVNKKYTTGLVIKRDDWNDDRVGGLGIRAREVGMSQRAYVDYLISDAVINGVNAGAGTVAAGAHFRTDHPVRNAESGTQSNLLTGTGTSVSQIQTDVGTALGTFLTFQNEDGLPFPATGRRFGVMVPAHVLFETREAIKAGIISQTSNVRFNEEQIEVWCNPFLDISSHSDKDVDDYYVYQADAPVAPFVFQNREPLSVETQNGEESDAYFEREEIRIKARFRGRAGYGRWQSVIKINNS